MIGIIDYGVGNVLAFANMYKRMNVPNQVVSAGDDLADVNRIILPGVGSFDFAMTRLNESGLRDKLDEAVLAHNKPVLGVCVGMQMLAESSDEGELPGLNWISGKVRRFCQETGSTTINLPHMGWNNLSVRKDSALLRGLEEDAWFYYLHSYYFDCSDETDEIASCEYGGRFSSVVNHDNIYGVQFHPEKSHQFGARLLRNFSEA